MRIVYMITRLDSLGGAQVHVRDMSMAMRATGHEVFVLSGSRGPFCDDMESTGVGVHVLPSLGRALNPWRDAKALYEILQSLGKLHPEILSLHSSKAGWLGRIAGRMKGVPTVFTAHGWAFSGGLPWYRTMLYRNLEKIAGVLSGQVVTVCEQDRRLAARYGLVPEEKLVVIHNGVHDLCPQPPSEPSSGPVHLVMVARFQEPKKHDDLLLALSRLRDMPWSLEFIGDGPLQPTIVSLAKELGFKERVRFSGACTDVGKRLERAQLFVMLSAREGFPRSILEAMRAGLPVVASNVGGIRESVVEGQTGYLVEAGNLEQLVERLQLLLSNPELRASMGRLGRERFVQEFKFEVMFGKTLNLYNQLHGFNRQAGPGESVQ